MLYSTKTEIRRILFDSSDNLDVVLPVRGLSNVQAVDFDINSHRLFWIEDSRIKFAYQNGSSGDKVINLDPEASPYDLAIDPYAKQLFWTDSVTNSINVYSLRNNTNLGEVFKKDGVSPRSIVLYPEKGWVFIPQTVSFIFYSIRDSACSSLIIKDELVGKSLGVWKALLSEMWASS